MKAAIPVPEVPLRSQERDQGDDGFALARQRRRRCAKIWSVARTAKRNRFQLDYLQGKDVYAWFERELIRQRIHFRPLMPHQKGHV